MVRALRWNALDPNPNIKAGIGKVETLLHTPVTVGRLEGLIWCVKVTCVECAITHFDNEPLYVA